MRHGFLEERTRARRRNRFIFGTIKWSFLLTVFVAIGFYAYEAGTMLAQQDAIELRERVAALTDEVATLQRDKSRLAGELAEVTRREADLKQRYAADVPTGTISDLVRLARDKLSEGVDPKRLASVINLVQNSRSCDGKPVTKRFLVRVGSQQIANDTVSFADRTITVSAEGQPATDGTGNQEGWYDPAKPLTLHITQIGGKTTTAEGTLPLHHSVVVNDMEHRFVVTAGDSRGFANVTSDSCRYP
jgi:hypothetical protein